MIIQTYEQNPQPRAIRTAVEVLRDGGLIVYPTDTIYGLGCDLHNKRALEKLYRIKGMDEKSPLSFISPDLSKVSQYAQVGNRAYRIMNKCLPGPFTFILPAMKEVNRYMLYKRKQIGIRVPAKQCVPHAHPGTRQPDHQHERSAVGRKGAELRRCHRRAFWPADRPGV